MKWTLIGIILGLSAFFADGVAAYRAGRFKDAFESFRAAEREAGPRPSVDLETNLAMAALATGDWTSAEIAAEKVLVFGGEDARATYEFLSGNISFRRADLLEAIADMPGADPRAFDDAIRMITRAADSWKRAVVLSNDWIEAKRNVERALLKIEDLEIKKAEAEKKNDGKKREKKPNPQRDPKKKPDEKSEEKKRDPRTEKPFVIRSTELSDDAVKKLMERLSAKDLEKKTLRRTRLLEQGLSVEKDW